MKKNNQGFMLVEALIMSMIVIGTLTFMYIQFQNISKSYEKSFTYNTVTNLYITNEVKMYLIDNNLLDNYENEVDNNTSKYIEINDISESNFNELKNKGKIKTILLTDEPLSYLKGRRTNTLSEKFNDFISYVKVDKEDQKYRLLIEFTDDTYASLKIENYNNNSSTGSSTLYWDYNYKEVVKNSYEFDYTGAVQEFTVPKTGKYKLEVWGAQGGDSATTSKGGKGGYAKGTVSLTQGTKLYVYVGGEELSKYVRSNSFGQTLSGGFNGGGNITKISTGNSGKYYATGGGASDVRIKEDSLYSRVIVAGGGGGSTSNQEMSNTGCTTVGGVGSDDYNTGSSSTTKYNNKSCYGGDVTNDIVYIAAASGAGLLGPGGFTRNPDTYNKTYSYKDCTSMNDCENFGYGGWVAPNSTTAYSYCSGGGGWFGAYSGKYSGGGGGSNWTYTRENYDAITSTITDFSTNWLLNSTYYLTDTSTESGVQEGNGKVIITYDGNITSNEQTFIVPYSGTYKIELLSPKTSTVNTHKYLKKEQHLYKNNKLYISVGKYNDNNGTTVRNSAFASTFKVTPSSTSTSTIPSDIPTNDNDGFVRITLISKD